MHEPTATSDWPFPSRWVTGLGVLAVVVGFVHGLRFDFKMDDAYIAFAYARNWAQGLGLVFNPGERVEGYTCFLWVALAALGITLGVDVATWSRLWCLLATAGTVGATWCLAAALLPQRQRPFAALAAVAIASYPPLAWWTGSRMETVLFTCWMTSALAFHVRRGATSIAAPLCLAAAALTRPEGWWLSALLCADALHRGPRRGAWRYIAIVVALFAPYYAWRCWYYGYPLPNTFYAKVGASGDQVWRGLRYLYAFALEPSTWWLAAFASLARWQRRSAVVPLLLVIYVAYIVAVGGDVFAHYRFFVPIVPALCAAAAAGMARFAGRQFNMFAAGVAATLVFCLTCVPMYRDQRQALPTIRLVNGLLELPCAAIVRNTTAADSVAAVGIGLLKYYTNRRVIDLVGLADAHIAHRSVPHMGRGLPGHEKYDADYVLAQRPAYIFIPLKDFSLPWQLAATQTLWEHPDLQRYYVGEEEGMLTWYRRRDMPPLAPLQR
jgi:hypothetical protein